MAINSKCILITGVGHSGTRLVMQMFARHPEVCVPFSILNRVEEYTPLHQFFIKSMDSTPLDSNQYAIDFEELHSILASYMLNIDTQRGYFVLKLPYYPLNCLDFFVHFFKGNIVFLLVRRLKNRIMESFVSRGEDKSLFLSNPVEFTRQIKKIDVSRREKYLTTKDFSSFLEDMIDYVEEKVKRWDRDHPDMKFVDIDIEQFATSKDYLYNVLTNLGVSVAPIDQMLSIVNKNRLLWQFTGRLRRIFPPPMRSLGIKLWARKKPGIF